MSPTFADILAQLVALRDLRQEQAEFCLEELLAGRLDPAQIGALLALLQAKGVTTAELVGGAIAMRRHVTPVPLSAEMAARAIDTCGTGGAPKLFNVSTAAALVAAGAGAKVVKHGNRSRTGRGSAEILQALGVHVEASPAVQARCVEEAGVCFCFAIHHHPAAKHAAGPRRALGLPTIFNLLGPLTNPGGARRQLLGVAKRNQVDLIAHALAKLGCERAMVAHSLDGFDELSTTSTNTIAHVRGNQVVLETLDAATLGIARAKASELQSDTLEHASATIREILDGVVGPKLDMVVLNAAAALVVAGVAGSMADGLVKARASVMSGAAKRTLEQLVMISNAG
ncbi:MAG: anthranilate phosphoribosyltransferase [Phycisphaerales bacterium]|nr:anthranilate phosphoribosyltransferase [Phycisphaerales bacterium]